MNAINELAKAKAMFQQRATHDFDMVFLENSLEWLFVCKSCRHEESDMSVARAKQGKPCKNANQCPTCGDHHDDVRLMCESGDL